MLLQFNNGLIKVYAFHLNIATLAGELSCISIILKTLMSIRLFFNIIFGSE